MIRESFAVLALVAAASTGTHAQAPAAKAVDFCKLLTTAEASAILGAAVSEATAEAPQGSLLGGCKYGSMGGVILTSARPAAEFERSVKAYKDLESVDAGPGVTAHYSRTVGMLMSQTGKPYFIHIVIAGASGPKTSDRFVAVAKKIVAKG